MTPYDNYDIRHDKLRCVCVINTQKIKINSNRRWQIINFHEKNMNNFLLFHPEPSGFFLLFLVSFCHRIRKVQINKRQWLLARFSLHQMRFAIRSPGVLLSFVPHCPSTELYTTAFSTRMKTKYRGCKKKKQTIRWQFIIFFYISARLTRIIYICIYI